ncbi:hypothetical protein [Kingella potus]|nr:hypothetical protein [Kingella potus]
MSFFVSRWEKQPQNAAGAVCPVLRQRPSENAAQRRNRGFQTA